MVLELDPMLIELGEVFLRLLGCRSTQTFVVFDLPAGGVIGLCPLLVLGNREERLALLTFRCLDDRRHELLKEAVHLE